MSELALYRKYRSQTFDEVVGQEHIVATIKAAVAGDKLGHAYLFTGPRGVGKTTLARLLARSANCTGEPPAGGKPCGKCTYCAAAQAEPLDIIEIDAASNRGIDEIRELRDKIALAPSLGRYKIYIIDEVHMLTDAAFNALLKTLEEPPAHAIFVLATTEAHKLPDTIISRTQRFNFRPIATTDLVRQLRSIAQKEGINITPEAVALIAEASRGGFRDAISLLDQVATTGAEITPAAVQQLLGWADSGAIDRLCTAIIDRQPAAALTEIDAMTAAGAPVGQIIEQTTRRWRQVLLAMNGAQTDADPSVQTWQQSLTLPRALELLDAFLALGKANWPEVALEAAVIRLSMNHELGIKETALSDERLATGDKRQATSIAASPTEPQLEARSLPPEAESAKADDSALWPKALVIIKNSNNSLYALLRACGITLNGNDLTITCRFNFHRDRLNEPKNRELIERTLQRVYGRPIRAKARVENVKPIARTVDTSSELVGSALEILGGEVIDG